MAKQILRYRRIRGGTASAAIFVLLTNKDTGHLLKKQSSVSFSFTCTLRYTLTGITLV